jgi:Fe-S-cluster containining protein
MSDVGDETVAWVERLHAVVSELAAPIEEVHGPRITCRAGCSGCCVDGLTVFAIEAAVIARRYPELCASGEPHAEGACAFLDAEGRCRVYEARPYVCRTQGLPLRWLEEDEDGAPVEARDVCPLNLEGGVGLEELEAEACWTIGPIEQRLAERQAAEDGGRGTRVPLRSLFHGGKRRLPLTGGHAGGGHAGGGRDEGEGAA